MHRRRGVDTVFAETEHHRHVAELQVAVDEHDRLGRTLRHGRGHVDGDAILPTPPWVENPEMSRRVRRCGPRSHDASGGGAGEELADPVDRPGRRLPRRRSRPRHAPGPERLL